MLIGKITTTTFSYFVLMLVSISNTIMLFCAAIITELFQRIHPEKSPDSVTNSGEEKEWLGYACSSFID